MSESQDNAAASNPKLLVSTRDRVHAIIYRFVLTSLVVGTLSGLSSMISQREVFEALFPGARGALYYVVIAAYALGLIPVVGLFMWKRWGIALFALSGLVLISLDFAIDAPTKHTIATSTGTLIILAMSFVLRTRFARK